MKLFNWRDGLGGSEGDVNKVSSGNAGFKGSAECAGGDARCDFCSVVLKHGRCVCRENSERAASRNGKHHFVGELARSADLQKMGRLSTET